MKICISLVKKMMKKEEGDAFEEEIEELERVKARQAQYYRDDISYILRAVDEMKKILEETKEDM